MKKLLQSKWMGILAVMAFLFSITAPVYGQLNETEPNENPTDTGVLEITADNLVVTGEMNIAVDYWVFTAGNTASITLAISFSSFVAEVYIQEHEAELSGAASIVAFSQDGSTLNANVTEGRNYSILIRQRPGQGYDLGTTNYTLTISSDVFPAPTPAPVDPSAAWELPINVSMATSSAYQNGAMIGTAVGATDVYDENYDIPAPPPPAGGEYVRATFQVFGESGFGSTYFADYIGAYDVFAEVNQWFLDVETNVADEVFISIPIAAEFTYLPITVRAVSNGELLASWTGGILSETSASLDFSFVNQTAEIFEKKFLIEVGGVDPPTIDVTNTSFFSADRIVRTGVDHVISFSVGANAPFDVTLEMLPEGSDPVTGWFALPEDDQARKMTTGPQLQSVFGYTKNWTSTLNFTYLDEFGVPFFENMQEQQFRITASITSDPTNKTVYTSENIVVVGAPDQKATMPQGWSLIGLPFENLVTDGTIVSELVADVEGYGVAYDWTGTTYNSDFDLISSFGFWFGASSVTPVSVTGDVYQHISSDPLPIEFTKQRMDVGQVSQLGSTTVYTNLALGWQIVSAPYVLGTDINDLVVVLYDVGNMTNTDYTVDQAIANGLISNFYFYDGSTYVSDAEVLDAFVFDPWEGFWIGALVTDLSIEWKPTYRPAAVLVKQESADANLITLKGSFANGAYSTIGFGFDGNASGGFDAGMDVFAPPSAPESGSLAMLGEATVLGNRYSRLMFDGASSATFPVAIDGTDETVTLSWEGTDFDGIAMMIINDVAYDLSVEGSVIVGDQDDVKVMLSPQTTTTEPGFVPGKFALGQNYPNPFNPSTAISYDLASTSHVKISVMNMLGQDVAVLVNGQMPAGSHMASFDASNLSSGMYLYRMQAGSFMQTRKMSLVK